MNVFFADGNEYGQAQENRWVLWAQYSQKHPTGNRLGFGGRLERAQ
jgi:hypothetical protein